MSDDGWVEVKPDFAVRVTDLAHGGGCADECGHKEGFCVACAEISLAVNQALIQLEREQPQRRRFRWWFT